MVTVERELGWHVDKDELIKALAYDRNQYDKGYADAKSENEWVPVSERLPKEPFGCLAIVEDERFDGGSFVPCQSLLPYFIGYDGTSWNDCDGEACDFEVIAWMPIPEYKEADR